MIYKNSNYSRHVVTTVVFINRRLWRQKKKKDIDIFIIIIIIIYFPNKT